MRTLLLTALFAALASPGLAAPLEMANGYGAIDAPRDTNPVALGTLFCDARISGDMRPIARFFAPKLNHLLETTSAGFNVPWQAFPDHPRSCEIAVLNGFDNTIGVLVEVRYVADGRRWADTLNLERTPDSWLLNNVFYEGGGNLRFKLLAASP